MTASMKKKNRGGPSASVMMMKPTRNSSSPSLKSNCTVSDLKELASSRLQKRLMEKRRLTWCPGKMSRETWSEPCSTVEEEASMVKPRRKARDVAPLLPFEDLVKESLVKLGRKARDVAPFLPFEDLVKESSVADPCTEEEERNISMKEDSILPNPVSLLNVTSRRKAAPRRKNLQTENNESAGTQLQYDDLLVKYETKRAKSGMEPGHLKKILAMASDCHDERHIDSFTRYDNVRMDQRVNQMFIETKLFV